MKKEWKYQIDSKTSLFDLKLNEIWSYKDLLFLLVKRDIVTVYKQTVLGPLWFLVQPILTSVIFTIVFNGIGNISVPGNVSPFLFNMAGITIWNYFSECLKSTSTTFTKNQQLYSKVYFPRVIMPISVIFSNLFKMSIQFIIFISFYIYFYFNNKAGSLNNSIIFLPILLLLMGFLGLGFGLIISSMTTKYRDLSYLVTFGVSLLSYLSAVMYPIEEAVSKLENKIKGISVIIENNPLSKIIESYRYMFFSEGSFSIMNIIYSVILTILIFLMGLIIFNKTEKNFIDTV